VRPGVPFAEVVQAMEEPLRQAGCWAKTPLTHTLTFGSTGFTAVNREQLQGTSEAGIEGQIHPGIRRPELVLRVGMGLELEPNACLGTHRVNLGAPARAGFRMTREREAELLAFASAKARV